MRRLPRQCDGRVAHDGRNRAYHLPRRGIAHHGARDVGDAVNQLRRGAHDGGRDARDELGGKRNQRAEKGFGFGFALGVGRRMTEVRHQCFALEA